MARVLVVDDEKSIRMSLRAFLEREGHEVETAEDAQEATRLLEGGEFDVVVSDIILPRVTGVELLKTIREVAPHVPVILMTGEPTAETASEAVRTGAFDYLFKPIGKAAIIKAVASAARVKALEDERRRLEEENRNYQVRLDRLVEERTGALRESEEKHRRILEEMEEGYYEVDLAGNFTFFNASMCRILGYSREDMTGMNNRHYMDAQNARKVFGIFNEVYRTGEPAQAPEWELMRKDGAVRSVEASVSLMQDSGGRPIGFRGVVRDITERKQAEEELRRLAAAIEQAGEVVMITDAEGTIQYVNPAFERITGYSRDEAVGQNPRILKSGRQDDAFYKQLWDTITAGEVWSGRFVNMRKDGRLYEEGATISPVLDSTGRIINYVAVKRDVTDQISLERRFRQAQKMEAIGTLAGGIAHDFNNVLAAIIGYSEMASEQLPDDSSLRSDLDHVLSAADRAKGLVRQILTFSRQVEEERKPLKLHLIVKEALKFLRPSLPATIEIREDIDKKCAAVLADPVQMHQVLMNLCTNAYHAMRKDGGILQVSLQSVEIDSCFAETRPELSEGTYARLTVSDTGHGMHAETLERIFEPFFTTKPEGEGTGLGLATVRGIVKAHGGAISVYSEPGKGTTFHVYLPGVESVEENETPEEQAVRGGNERILVVDDEEVLADLVARALRAFGYDVFPMTSSVDALAAFRSHPELFDLIITDQTMPRMTGDKLAGEVMRIRPEIPVILSTGFSDTVIAEKAEELGISAFLPKPSNALTVARTVREVLDRAEGPNA